LALLGLTAAGPFVFAWRCGIRRTAGYPRPGDVIWMLLGLPWTISAPLMEGAAGSGAWILGLSLAISCTLAMMELWRSWICDRSSDGRVTTTEAIGLALGVAWPVQVALALMLVG
jgi:hypothetical protein